MGSEHPEYRYVIVGNSAGGIGAAEAIREADSDGSMLIVSDEPYPAYSRPMISEYLAGEKEIDDILFRPRGFYAEKRIETLLSKKASALDVARRILVMEDGTALCWEHILLACGGSPIFPRMTGSEKMGVFTFTTLRDADRMSAYLHRVRSAVVIGGGLIGVSVAEALVKHSVQVTIVEMRDHVLSLMLDEETSEMEAAAIRNKGVSIVTGHTVVAINGLPGDSDHVGGVVLDDGTELTCDMVVVAIGVSPRLELAKSAGIRVNRGILVGHDMQTSHNGVYACGDVAEAYDFAYGTERLTPIWPNAYLGGKVAGYNMAGQKASYPGGTAMNSLKYFHLPIVSAGLVSPVEGDYEVLSRTQDSVHRKVVLKDGRIVGMVFVLAIENAGIVYGLMRDGVIVSDFKQKLLDDDFGLASLPYELRQERLKASTVRKIRSYYEPLATGAAG
ncbi:MAG: FAD-dependent oxidoreductase [Chloroflexota bacterium]